MFDPEQTRRLKKYESGEQVMFRDAGPPSMDFLSPFGPLIAKTQSTPSLVDRINAFADSRLTAGQGAELHVPEDVCLSGGDDSLASTVARQINAFVKGSEDCDVARVEFDVFWIVSQYTMTPSPMHFHSGDISGVLYLKVPEIAPQLETRNYIAGRQAGYINFMIGGKQRFSRSLISFKPVVGDFYIFPGWLLHGAEPFVGTGERRSLAFNATVQT